MSNKYSGKCEACGKIVGVGQGNLEWVGKWHAGQRRKSPYKLWCMDCFNKSDNSGPEDRCCGDRAYEDQCARACGFDTY